MHQFSRGAATHSSRLERWLGKREVEQLSASMRSFYWPVALQGVPGNVYAMPGGDFAGKIVGGSEMSALDRAQAALGRLRRRGSLNAFATLQAMLQARASGKACEMYFQKTLANINVSGEGGDTWMSAGQPAAGAAGGAAPGGTSPTNATTGAFPFKNAVSSADSSHFVEGWLALQAGFQFNSLLLYDRLFMVAKTMNSTATESVTGTFSRYQSATSTAENYAGGNFCFPAVGNTQIPSTGHNWTVCQYTNQAGTTGQSFPSALGRGSGAQVQTIDLQDANAGGGSNMWFMPLASGDVGVKALTQMQCSALLATGTLDFVVGHPIAWLTCPIASLVCMVEGINTAFSMTRVYDNACLALLAPSQPTGGGLVTGKVITVSE